MKSVIQFGVSFFALALAVTAHSTTITYSATDISGSTWEYNYTISNTTQPGNIGEFMAFLTDSLLQKHLT
jgi:hypothetical protein